MSKKIRKNNLFTKLSHFFKKKGGTPCQPFKKETDGMSETPIKEEYERCVMCGTVTSIPTSMPIDWRENYEIGCGQICVKCARKHQNTTENTLTTAQIFRAVEISRKETKNQSDTVKR